MKTPLICTKLDLPWSQSISVVLAANKVHTTWLNRFINSVDALPFCFIETLSELYRFYCYECTIHTTEKNKSEQLITGFFRSLYDSVINALLVILFLRGLRHKNLIWSYCVRNKRTVLIILQTCVKRPLEDKFNFCRFN